MGGHHREKNANELVMESQLQSPYKRLKARDLTKLF